MQNRFVGELLRTRTLTSAARAALGSAATAALAWGAVFARATALLNAAAAVSALRGMMLLSEGFRMLLARPHTYPWMCSPVMLTRLFLLVCAAATATTATAAATASTAATATATAAAAAAASGCSAQADHGRQPVCCTG